MLLHCERKKLRRKNQKSDFCRLRRKVHCEQAFPARCVARKYRKFLLFIRERQVVTFHLARCMGHLQSKGTEFCRNACLPVVSERCRRLRIREKPASVAKGVGSSAFGIFAVRADQCRNGVFLRRGIVADQNEAGKSFASADLKFLFRKSLPGLVSVPTMVMTLPSLPLEVK